MINIAPTDVDSAVEAYEAARERDPGSAADLRQFAPEATHPAYATVVVELVRVDLEHTWQPNDPSRLARYRTMFPGVWQRADLWSQVAFEEFRLRTMAGEQVAASEYQRKYGCDVSGWPRERAEEAEHFPAAGDSLFGFELLEILGQGAFGRVYLARQVGLANRLVALKITAGESAEPQQLAQLQHTNIVPIYSYHREGPWSGVCMPYLGRLTLAQLLSAYRVRERLPAGGAEVVTTIVANRDATLVDSRRENHGPTLPDELARPGAAPWAELAGRSYVSSIAWIAARLAEGLAHAHQRGIVHRDLKPANILLGDDGQPLILDFNVSGPAASGSAAVALQGGTLPYMSPEQLAAFGHGGDADDVDQRSDVYSLGVILYQLMTGELPFPAQSGNDEAAIAAAVEDRRQAVRSPRALNPAVSPGLESILLKCLAFETSERYASAQQLGEDLTRYLEDRPLRFAVERSWIERAAKWRRRHPRIVSSTTVGLVAAVLLTLTAAGWMVRERTVARLAAADQFRTVSGEFPVLWSAIDDDAFDAATREEFHRRAEAVCEQYEVGANPQWRAAGRVALLDASDQARLQEKLQAIVFLRSEFFLGEGRRASDAARKATLDEALRLNRLVVDDLAGGQPSPAVLLQGAAILDALDRKSEAAAIREQAAAAVSHGPMDSRLLAARLLLQREFAQARSVLEPLARQQPEDFSVLLQLGKCEQAVRNRSAAAGYFTACIALRPDLHWGWFFRGVLRLEQREFAAAKADFDEVVRLQPACTSAVVNRALAARGMGKHDMAVQDLEAARERGGVQSRVLLLLGQSYQQLGDRPRADAILREWAAQTPTDDLSWVTRGVRRMKADPAGACDDFHEALRLNPTSSTALQNLAHVLSEKLGRTDDAIEVLSRALAIDPDQPLWLGSRGVLRARREQREGAISDALAAVRHGPEDGLAWYQAACVYALLGKGQEESLGKALACLTQAVAKKPEFVKEFATDRDLTNLWERTDFQQFVAAGDRSLAGQRAALKLSAEAGIPKSPGREQAGP
jgi:eukaryotic-like serine/threonine-protein kinase